MGDAFIERSAHDLAVRHMIHTGLERAAEPRRLPVISASITSVGFFITVAIDEWDDRNSQFGARVPGLRLAPTGHACQFRAWKSDDRGVHGAAGTDTHRPRTTHPCHRGIHLSAR